MILHFPTNVLMIARDCRIPLGALLVTFLLGCGGGQAVKTNPVTQPIPGDLAESILPSLTDLNAGRPKSTSLTNNPDPSFPADAYVFSGGNVSNSGGGKAILTASAEGIAYAIYRFSDLALEDKLESVTVDASATGSGAAFEYYLLFSDYGSGNWKTAAMQQAVGARTMGIENPRQVVSEIGTSYVALITSDSAAIEAISVTAHFDFIGRYAPHHIVTSLPERDSAGVDIRFTIEAFDEAGLTKVELNGPATISGTPFGLTVPMQPTFVAGIAKATINFSDTGNFSLSIDGIGEEASGVFGSILVHRTNLPVYEIEIAESSLASLNGDPWSDEYYSAIITLEGQQFPGIRVRYRGGTTRDLPKKSWKVKLNSTAKYADPDWGYDSKTLNINAQYADPTMLREKLSYDIFKDLNVLTPRARFVHLRVNGEFQGVYTQVEQPRKDWLTSFGINPDGPLYEAKNSNLEELPTPADYVGLFDKELNELEPFDDLAGFVSAFNNWPEGSFNSSFLATVDGDNYLNYMLANTLISQGDQILKNYLLYLDQAATGHWYVIPWDHDLTWGHQWSAELGLFDFTPHYGLPIDYGSFLDEGGWGNFLMDRWLTDPQFEVQFKAAIADALDNYFTEAEFIGRVDDAYNLILEDALADPQKYTDSIEYSVWVEELREYVRQRRTSLAAAIL